MPTYLQADRLLKLTTPLGPDALLLHGLDGREAISELFRFTLLTAAERATTVAFDKLLGQGVTAELALDGGKTRFFHGLCSRIAEGGRDQTFAYYTLEIVPEVWLLTRKAQSRIFQQKSVPEILKVVFTGMSSIIYEIQGTFPPATSACNTAKPTSTSPAA